MKVKCYFCERELDARKYIRTTKLKDNGNDSLVFICDRCLADQRCEDYDNEPEYEEEETEDEE